ncbi:MAG: MFS transporter [Firmicutes bacterium]|nr:MFS transporter [Bacillota bacterium]
MKEETVTGEYVERRNGNPAAYRQRVLYLIVGIVAMLFAGVIYAWSILKAPLAAELGFQTRELALNFTLTMCFFCLGGFLGGQIAKRIGTRPVIIGGGILAGAGFLLSSRLSAGSALPLYLSYGLLAGLGIGIAYVVTISTVSAWFPDKKGLCSGCLMMGFGASTLILGNLASALIERLGWRSTYLLLGIAVGIVIVLAGLIVRLPGAGIRLPQAAPKRKAAPEEAFMARDFTTGEMIRRFSFWRAFLCIVFLAAVGNTVISFARDLALSVGASAGLATTLVGVLSVCNGLGRVATGAMFDALGRRRSMLIANIVTILAAFVTLAAVRAGSLPLGILGLCLTGLSYGSCPTFTSAFTAAFYGSKYFPTNFSVMNFNLMGASFIATAANGLLSTYGNYTAPFVLLLSLSLAAFVLNLSIRRP